MLALAITVNSDGNDDLSETQPLAPSPADPTRTSEPVPAAEPGAGPAPDLRPVPATQLRDPERYQIIGEHGRGGLGRVSRAHDRELGRDVAIKELISRGHVSEVRFLREALITARLEHPGIVPVHEAGRWPDGTPFYAMKLVSGRPLRDLIAERTTVEQRIGLLHHVIAVADAIAYAHGRNIIHRDLKPANVIVGDFGETVVIDWGLAKDLTATEDSALGGGPFRTNRDDDLTSAGSVLGTPAYMAPEQERGEHVDQRADVFAIGAMLWELCALQKVPPTDARQRHRMLRRAGIDQDLATILDKALEPDPKHRYPDAGALAADLKAFTSGARIAARSYSLPALLAHWIRRHRTLALSVTTALAVAAGGIVFYFQNITAERRRAIDSEQVAESARSSAETSLDELTLKHAQLLLATDPSATIDVLTTYHGAAPDRANQIRAEATGRGVAFLRAVPHTNNVLWTEVTASGAIVSLSTDGTISRTSSDAAPIVLARGVSRIGLSSYSTSRHLLAYACDPSDVCLFDVLHNARVPVTPILQGIHLTGIAFSPSGTLLALMSQETVLRILDVTDPSQPVLRILKSIHGGAEVKFLDDDVAVAGTVAGVEFVYPNGDSKPFPIPGGSYWDANTAEHKLAIATTRGQALILADLPLHITARNTLCHSPIVGLQFIHGRQAVAYACRDGTIGIWDLQQDTATPRAQLEGHADLLTVSPAGDYIVAAGGNGIVTVLDLYTDLVASYKGHGFRLTSITPPTREHPFLISADARGAVRAWPLPPRFARVATTSSTPFYTAIFNNQSSIVTATAWLSSLTTFSPSTGVRAIGGHETYNISLEQSNNGKVFAAYGLNDLVEVWSSATMTRTRLISTGQGSISQLRFVGDTDDFVTSGNDGRLVRWAPSGEKTPITQLNQPVEDFALAQATGSIVFGTVDGALWRAAPDGRALPLRSGGPRINRMLTLPDQRTVYAGYANGDVIAINTKSWQQKPVLHASGAIKEIAFTADGHTIAVATNDGTIHVGILGTDASNPDGATWVTLTASARDIALAPDGLLMATCTDGTIWLYSIPHRRWLCLPTGTADLGRVAMTINGNVAVALDREGRLIWIDLDAARKLLERTH